MKRSRLSEEQIIGILREAEAGSQRRGHRKVVRRVAVGSAGMVNPGIDGLEKRAG
jgi:hypothetical protein